MSVGSTSVSSQTDQLRALVPMYRHGSAPRSSSAMCSTCRPRRPRRGYVVGVMAPPLDEAVSPHWGVNFWVSDADAIAAKAAELGGDVVVAPTDGPGFRDAVVADPEGARLSVSQLIAGP